MTDPEREELLSLIRDLQKERDDYRNRWEEEFTKTLERSPEFEEQKREIIRLRREVARLELYNDTMKVAQ